MAGGRWQMERFPLQSHLKALGSSDERFLIEKTLDKLL